MDLPRTAGNTKYKDIGPCSFCLMTLEAKQPGGTDARHKSTHTPYGQCEQAKAAKKQAADRKG